MTKGEFTELLKLSPEQLREKINEIRQRLGMEPKEFDGDKIEHSDDELFFKPPVNRNAIYNQAITAAIEVVDENMRPYYDPHSIMLKEKLEALKKKP